MENIKFIDITQLPEDLWQDAKNLIAIDSNGEVIKAEKQDSYTKDEIDDLLKDSEISADKLQNKIKINSASTDYVVTQPTVSGDSLVITDSMSDKNQYHTLGFDKIGETTEIGDVRKYVDFNREFDSSDRPIIHTNFDNYENIPLDFSNITDDGDVYIIYFYGSFVNFENGTEGKSFYSYITYNKTTKILKAIDNELITSNQFKRSDTDEYIFNTSQMQFDCNQLQDGAYLIWSIYVSPGLYYRFNASTAGKLFVGETTTTSPTSRLPQRKNEFFRYENGVKSYILTDKNTTFKTINGEQILGDGNIEVSANVDLSNYYTKLQTNKLVYPKLSQVTLTQAEYDALSTKENNILYVISDAEDIKFKTINGEQITGEGNITIDTNVDLSNYATKAELNTKQNVISDLGTIRSGAAKGATALQSVPSEYATEQWVNSQGFLKEHQDISNLATKQELATKQDTLVSGENIKTVNGESLLGSSNMELATKAELNAKQDVISDLDSIRSGAALGATALQSVPSEYATEQWVNEQGFLKEHQDISNLATKAELNAKQDVITDLDTIRSGAALGATALQSVPSEYVTETELNNKGYLTSVPDTYALKSEIPDISTKQDTLVSGTNIKTVNGTSLLGSGNIEIAKEWIGTQAQYDALSTKDNNTTYYITE